MCVCVYTMAELKLISTEFMNFLTGYIYAQDKDLHRELIKEIATHNGRQPRNKEDKKAEQGSKGKAQEKP